MDTTTAQKKFDECQALQQSGEYEQAANGYSALLQEVSHPLIANALGFCLKRMGKSDFAERVWLTALQDDPDCVPVLANLGNLFTETHRYKSAVEVLDRAIEVNPSAFNATQNRTVLAINMGDNELAERLSEKAVSLRGEDAMANHTLSLAYMLNGKFDEGFGLYDWRKAAHNREDPPLPKYDGGKAKVIVSCEQGLGDTLMVARWLPNLAAEGADVYISCPSPLKRILKQSDLCKIHDEKTDDYTHFFWTMDLMKRYSKGWTDFGQKTYLFAGEKDHRKWSQRLSDKPKIGICFSGGQRLDDIGSTQIDRRRSLSPSEAHQIVRSRPDAEWVNLTREWGLPDCTDFGRDIADFADLAALISNLDMVITVDTAVAHLAGGLGVDTLMLSRYDACWRWYPYQKQAALYENMRCYFQPRPFDWQAVIDRVVSDIRKNR